MRCLGRRFVAEVGADSVGSDSDDVDEHADTEDVDNSSQPLPASS